MRKCANLVEIKNASKRILVFTIYSQKSSSKQPRTNPAKLGNYKKTIALANFAIQFKASPAASDAERRPGTLLWRPNPRAALGGAPGGNTPTAVIPLTVVIPQQE